MKEIIMPNGDRGFVLTTNEEAAAAEQLSNTLPRGRIVGGSVDAKILAELARRFPVTERIVVRGTPWQRQYKVGF